MLFSWSPKPFTSEFSSYNAKHNNASDRLPPLLVALIGCYSNLVQADHAIGMAMTCSQRTPNNNPTTNRSPRTSALATMETTKTTTDATDAED
ncbi:hypothetical protein PHYSODRAFT_265376, partial [Phytophthora sojae]